MKYAKSPNEVPASPHYAAIIFSSVHIPGDERSRTNPGHGYPAEDCPVCEYITFEAKAEMQAWVKKKHLQNDFVIIEAFPKRVTVEATVKVE